MVPACHLSAPTCPTYVPSETAIRLGEAIKIISMVAISIFGIITAPELFLLGLALGAIYEFTLIVTKLSPRQQGDTKPLCAQGVVEDYLGRKAMPHETEAVKATFFFFCHIMVCPTICCPVFGALIGGRIIGELSTQFAQKQLS